MVRAPIATAVALLLSACFESEHTPVCHDQDGDRFGEGDGCAGPDCDDTNPAVRSLCPPERCASAPEEGGCPCSSEAQPLLCYEGPEGTEGVGACGPGLRSCVSGSWSACEGQTLPAREGCDLEDDDCDGEVDEGAHLSCDDCNPLCERTCAGVGCDEPFEAGAGGVVAPDGSLWVGEGRDVTPHLLWVVSDLRAIVTRVETGARRIAARYIVGPRADDTDAQAVAMNVWGDALVVSNAHQGPAGAWATFVRASDCEDADGDGAIATSQGWGDVRAWGEDECVGWSVELSTSCPGGCAGSGVTFAEEGATAWVTAGTARIEEVDVGEGVLTGRSIDAPEAALAILADGSDLWIATATALYSAPLADPEVVELVQGGLSGIGRLDLDGLGRIYAGAPLGRWDPGFGFDFSAAITFDFGLDPSGTAWVLDGASPSSLSSLDTDLLEDRAVTLDQFYFSMTPDLDGQLWTARPGQNLVAVWDATTLQAAGTLDDPACETACPDHPMLHGDPAALRYRRAFGARAPFTTASHVFEFWCDWGWDELAVFWEGEGQPAPRVRARWAFGRDSLDAAELVDLPTSPAALPVRDWGDAQLVLEVQAELRGRAVQLRRIQVEWTCQSQGF